MRDRRITKRLVDSLKPNGEDHFVWDDTLIGFGVRMQPTRAKYRPHQANRMLAVVGSLYAFAGKRKILPVGFNPVRGIEQYPEKGACGL
jgi:hypothetical protein